MQLRAPYADFQDNSSGETNPKKRSVRCKNGLHHRLTMRKIDDRGRTKAMSDMQIEIKQTMTRNWSIVRLRIRTCSSMGAKPDFRRMDRSIPTVDYRRRDCITERHFSKRRSDHGGVRHRRRAVQVGGPTQHARL